MKTIAPAGKHTRLKIRARWIHPGGHRLILVEHTLFRAGPSGPYVRVAGLTDSNAVIYAKKHGFRRTTNVAVNGNATDSDACIDELIRANTTQLDFREYIKTANAKRRVRRLDFDPASQMLLESMRSSVPVSTIDDGTPGSRIRYLRHLGRIGRRVAEAGQRGRLTAPPAEVDHTSGGCKSLPWWAVVCNCAECGKHVRAEHQVVPEGAYRKDISRVMKVPVLVRYQTRPFCPGCVPQPKTA